jgi:hypothetical protein
MLTWYAFAGMAISVMAFALLSWLATTRAARFEQALHDIATKGYTGLGAMNRAKRELGLDADG